MNDWNRDIVERVMLQVNIGGAFVERREVQAVMFQNSIGYQDTWVYEDYPLHWHNFYEFEMIISGAGIHILNGQEMALRQGSIYFLTPFDLHRIQVVDPLHLESIKIFVDDLPEELAGFIHKNNKPRQSQLDNASFETISLRIRALLDEMMIADTYAEMSVYATATLMLAAVFRNTSANQVPETAGPSLKQMQNAIHYIHENYHKMLRLSDVADVVGLSPCYLSSQFSSYIGCRFSEYVTKCRIQHAMVLLENSNISVTDVGYSSGFGSLSHFLRTFRQIKGVSPGEYRANSEKSAHRA